MPWNGRVWSGARRRWALICDLYQYFSFALLCSDLYKIASGGFAWSPTFQCVQPGFQCMQSYAQSAFVAGKKRRRRWVQNMTRARAGQQSSSEISTAVVNEGTCINSLLNDFIRGDPNEALSPSTHDPRVKLKSLCHPLSHQCIYVLQNIGSPIRRYGLLKSKASSPPNE